MLKGLERRALIDMEIKHHNYAMVQLLSKGSIGNKMAPLIHIWTDMKTNGRMKDNWAHAGCNLR